MNDQQETAEGAVERDGHGWPQSQLANFRRNVKDRRERQGLSQGDIAEAVTDLGLPMLQQTVYRIEAGSRAVRLEEAAAVAEVLGNTVVELFEAPEVKSLVEALDVLEQDWLGPALREFMYSQLRLAALADQLEQSGDLTDELRERVQASLRQSSLSVDRHTLERVVAADASAGEGEHTTFWRCAQHEALSPLPGIRLRANGGAQMYDVESMDPSELIELNHRLGPPPSRGTIEGIVDAWITANEQQTDDEG